VCVRPYSIQRSPWSHHTSGVSHLVACVDCVREECSSCYQHQQQLRCTAAVCSHSGCMASANPCHSCGDQPAPSGGSPVRTVADLREQQCRSANGTQDWRGCASWPHCRPHCMINNASTAGCCRFPHCHSAINQIRVPGMHAACPQVVLWRCEQCYAAIRGEGQDARS
jgi:hypothetical protein